MEKFVTYRLGPEDPDWPTRLEHAFNRVRNFASELDSARCAVPHRFCKLFNKVVCNREFTLRDWQEFHAYGLAVVSRAVQGAKNHSQEVADSIDQAALNLRDELAEFDLYIATH